MENARIADIFDEIADLIELQEGNPFRVRSYRMAAMTVRGLSQPIDDLIAQHKDLTKLPHIGRSTSEHIHEIIKTGTCARLEELRQEVPRELTELMRIPRLGPRKVMRLHRELGVSTVEELRRAAEEHRVRALRGMGAKEEENILAGIRTIASEAGRFLYKAAAEHVDAIGRYFDTVEAIERWAVAGSYRRCKETVGDLDILVQARGDDRAGATEAILGYPAIDQVIERGEERVSVTLASGMQVDIRFFEPKSFGAALLYFTGSKAHNIAVRKRAVRRHWKLNEYGLFQGEELLAGETEESVYRRLGMDWIAPELREDRGEVEAAEAHALPALLSVGDIRGDLHAHTKVTDGADTIEQMAEAARARGYQYLAITDHSKAVRMARGLDEDGLRRHAARIREVDATMGRFWLMAGVEVDILESGALDLDLDVLAELDWVVASVHYHWKMDRAQMTARLLRAVESGVVHCLGHPMGRLIGKRDALDFDVDAVLSACREHRVWVEIDCQPDRLDLPDIYCRRARELGVGVVIDTDAHSRSNLDFMAMGVAVARRGWLQKSDVLNTRTAGQLRKLLRR